MQRMSVLKGIKKIRCFWKLFWNIKWNVELMSCICAILLPWKYLSGVSLSTNHRSNLLLICTNNFSKPTHSAWVFTNFTSFKGNSKMDDNPMWKHEYGTTKQKWSTICKVRDKEGYLSQMNYHIETKYCEVIFPPCVKPFPHGGVCIYAGTVKIDEVKMQSLPLKFSKNN